MKVTIKIKAPKEKILIEEIEAAVSFAHEVGLEIISQEQYHKQRTAFPFRYTLHVSGEFKQIAELTAKLSRRTLA
jgi:hypothetical protein